MHMQRGRRYDPRRHAEQVGVRIVETPGLPGHGDYGNGIIRLCPGLTQAETRCTLAHELIHHERRDDLHGYCDAPSLTPAWNATSTPSPPGG